MISWCSAGQRLSATLRVAICSVSRRSVFIRPQPTSRALQTRTPVFCAGAPSTKSKAGSSAQSSRPKPVPKKAAQDSFYAPEAVTFTSLGSSPAVGEALHHAGFTRPSTVQVPKPIHTLNLNCREAFQHHQLLCAIPQELALPVLLDGVNAVVAAETGSGKTICYLVPIITQLLGKAHSGLPSEQRYMQHLLSLSYSTAACHCLVMIKEYDSQTCRFGCFLTCALF